MLRKLTAENFAAYGRIIEYPGKDGEDKSRSLFRIVLAETEKVGWRIAYLVVRDKKIASLEQHGSSYESFEPVKGKTLIYVTNEKDPKTIECFFLNKPVILNKGVWHGVVAVGRESEIKITENAEVDTAHWPLGFSLGAK